jgi:hypothetical protein
MIYQEPTTAEVQPSSAIPAQISYTGTGDVDIDVKLLSSDPAIDNNAAIRPMPVTLLLQEEPGSEQPLQSNDKTLKQHVVTSPEMPSVQSKVIKSKSMEETVGEEGPTESPAAVESMYS